MDKKILLIKCNELIDLINENIQMYKNGYEVSLFNEIPVIDNVSLKSYIDEINKYILPELRYIKDSLERNKKICKKKLLFGGYIVHNWSNKSRLGLKLMEVYNYLMYKN